VRKIHLEFRSDNLSQQGFVDMEAGLSRDDAFSLIDGGAPGQQADAAPVRKHQIHRREAA
jgi:hypothetical protein